MALIAASLHLMRSVAPTGAARDQSERERAMRWFRWTNAGQYAGIAMVIVAANLTGRQDLIAAGISLVVALHFFPIAFGFRNLVQYVTGVAILAWDLVWLLHAPHASTLPVLAGTGVALWVTTSVQLFMGYRLRRSLYAAAPAGP